MNWFNDREHGRCLACAIHDHDYDPRCPLCVVERIKAWFEAIAIQIRLVLPPWAE
jgi:hypothetical protein